MKESFEDKLIALSDEKCLKSAKDLLKRNAIVGAWREDGKIYTRVNDNGSMKDVCVTPGDKAKCVCSCGKKGFCAHGIATLLYVGRFQPVKTPQPDESHYYGGLKKEDLPSLIKRANGSEAYLTVTVVSKLPHAPTKWEKTEFSVRILAKNREYVGNVSNIHQLYFEKKLSFAIRLDDFSLQDQQILRFLAISGEANCSHVELNAEQTAEFLHCLINYPRFFKDGVRLTVRAERAEPVLIESKNCYVPGIKVNETVLPTENAKIIGGSSGCWIGCHQEYFFVPATCEIVFLRNFFRSEKQIIPSDVPSDKAKKMLPFPVVSCAKDALENRTPIVAIYGEILQDETFAINYSFIYDGDEDRKIFVRPNTGNLQPGKQFFWKRDIVFENNFAQVIEMFGFEIDGNTAVINNLEKAYLFIERVIPVIRKQFPGLLLGGKAFSGQKLFATPKISCKLRETAKDNYVVSYEIALNDQKIRWCELQKAAMENKHYLISECGIGKISAELGEFFRCVPGIIRNLDEVNQLFEVPFYSAASYSELAKLVSGAEIYEITRGPVSNAPKGKPKFHFSGKLRPYQEKGVEFLQRLTDCGLNPLLADEMGLGKTVQLLAFIASRQRGNDHPSLLICPASLVTNWERETQKFVPDLNVIAPIGDERDEVLKSMEKYDFIILSYTALRLSLDRIRKQSFKYVILDEAQRIKNASSSSAKNCKIIKSEHRIVLTGTPLENRPEDLWSIFDFLQSGMLGSLPAFRKRYLTAKDDKELQRDLSRRVAPFLLRRTKSEVAPDLPEKSDNILYCSMGKEQRVLYEKVRLQALRELATRHTEDESKNMGIFTTLLRLRQICCDPELLPDDMGKDIPSAKTELLMELLRSYIENSHKVLLFSQFTTMLHRLAENLTAEDIKFEYLDGTTQNRQSHIDKFNNNDDINVFLLSLKAGGVGINLTSADTVIIYDPWWNPAIESQATDRSHRIGQKRKVEAFRLVVKDSIEEKILSLQAKKQELFNSIVNDKSNLPAFTLKELQALLKQ